MPAKMCRTVRPRSSPLVRRLSFALVVAGIGACTSKAIVAETRDAQTPNDPTSAPRARDASASGGSSGVSSGGTGGSGTGGNDGALGNPFVNPGLAVNDPCDAAGFVELSDDTPDLMRVTAYVVTFEPPQVLLTRELTKTQYDSWEGRIDPSELPGAPDCMSLRADAVFLVDTQSDGTHRFPGQFNGVHGTPIVGDGFNVIPSFNSCSSAYVRFDSRIGSVSDVEGFELSLSDSSLEGPIQMMQGPLAWEVAGPDAGLLACNRPGYVNMVAAHADGVLVGLALHFSEDR